MKMAKASNDEWQRCMDFANQLDEAVHRMPDEELGRFVRQNYVYLVRVVFGYRVLVDNCCDPNSDVLEWKPEIATAMAKANQPQPEEL